jgi:hypothetical protein
VNVKDEPRLTLVALVVITTLGINFVISILAVLLEATAL